MATTRAIILSEIMRGKSFELTADLYTIGRTEANDICIPDGTLSSNHCKLVREGDVYKAIDQNSTNGTRINGEVISESYLKGADILQVGGIEILFDSESEANQACNATQTKISLGDDFTFGPADMKNINPIGTSRGAQSGSKKGFNIFIGSLAIFTIVLVYLVAQKFLF